MSLPVDCRTDDADKHGNDITCLVYKKEKLYSAAADGKIKCWSMDLITLAEVQVHTCSIYSLAANDNTIFSCSNDGSVKAFDLDSLKPKGKLIQEDYTKFWKLYYSDNCLYIREDEGNLKIWKNAHFYESLLIVEPIKDMVVSHHVLLCPKDTNVVITEVKVHGDILQFGIKKSYVGRAPLTLIGDKLFAFVSREGKDMIVHENDDHLHYKEVTKKQGAHEMIINALSGVMWKDKAILFSGGWDKLVKKWSIDENIGKIDTVNATLNADIAITAIVAGDKGDIYAGGAC